MVSIETSVGRTTAANLPPSSNWEKEFFTTWLRLMERQKDETNLTQTLQNLLAESGDATIKLQDAKHHVNMMSANDKTMTELVAQLNEFFFRDIAPALKRLKRAETTIAASLQRQQDPLDQYLEHGDDGTAMSQAFVNDMSGWAAPAQSIGQEKKKDNEKKANMMSYKSSQAEGEEGDNESENDEDLNDDIPSDMFHDMLIANSLKLTAMQAPDYSTMGLEHVFKQQDVAVSHTMMSQDGTAGFRTSAHSSTAASSSNSANSEVMIDKDKAKKVEKSSPILTYHSSRSSFVSISTPRTELHSPSDAAKTRDRITDSAAAILVADQVLDVRTYGKAKEYLIRWQGVSAPLWVTRRKSSPQAKELIDAYVAALRRQDSTSATQKHAQGASPSGRKKTSRHEANVQDAVKGGGSGADGAKFYTVDHIVKHRMRYNKRQYLVRWENYSESQDTWENADKLRVDVPDVVDAYEEELQRDHARADTDPSVMSDISCDAIAGSKARTTKRSIGSENPVDKSTTQLPKSVNRVAGEQIKEKRRRITTDDEGPMRITRAKLTTGSTWKRRSWKNSVTGTT